MQVQANQAAGLPAPTTARPAPAAAAAADGTAAGMRPAFPLWSSVAPTWQPLTAAQRKEISGLLPGLMVHTCSWLLLGTSPTLPHRVWHQAELLLVVAVAVLEISALCLCPALSKPPLRIPRRILGRLAFLASPSFRRTGVGMSRMLERPPLNGVLGALVDLARLILGTNVLSAFSQGAYASLPPVGQLLLQCALIKLVWNPAGICKMPMLQAPLAQQRLADMAMGLELGALCLMSPLQADSHTMFLLLSKRAAPERVCMAVVSFSQLAIGLLPVVLAAHGWRPSPEDPAQQRSSWRRAWRRSNQMLQCWARAWPGSGGFALRAWLFCAGLWMVCRLSAGLV